MQNSSFSKSELLDGLPPQNLDAEKAALGSLLLDADLCDEVALIIAAEDFYADANKRLYRHILEMREAGKRIDVLLLIERLKKNYELEEVGGSAYITEVAQSVPWAANAAYYARSVAEAAKLRRIIHTATEALRDAYSPTANVDAIIGNIENGIEAINAGREDTVANSMEIAIEVSDRIDAICNQKLHLGLQTGFDRFDQITGGLFASELIVLAARTGKGKSALATQIATNIARGGKAVYMVSLEMPPEDIAQRIVCERMEVNSRVIRTGNIDAETRGRLAEGIAAVGNLPIFWEKRDSINVQRIRNTAKTLAKKSLRLIVIDYVGLLDCNDGDERRAEWERQSRIAKGLKGLARELKIPILCLCQLNREVDEQERPQPKHLRGSGSWEQDAHVILFIHRPEGGIIEKKRERGSDNKHHIVEEKMEWDAELIIAKNRNGETGHVRMYWTPEFTRYSSWGDPRPTLPLDRETAFDKYGAE